MPIHQFDSVLSREANYRRANLECPWVRTSEREALLQLARPKAGQNVIDLGCGSGTVAVPIAHIVGGTGCVLALDGSTLAIDHLRQFAANEGLTWLYARALDEERLSSVLDESVDLVVSLAAFHHFENKERYVSEIARVLRPGGRLVVGDICYQTSPQQYFSYAVDGWCSTGHRCVLLDPSVVKQLCWVTGLAVESIQQLETPWRFTDKEEAASWLHTIHDAQCSPELCLSDAIACLGVTSGEPPHPFRLNWELMFFSAIKS